MRSLAEDSSTGPATFGALGRWRKACSPGQPARGEAQADGAGSIAGNTTCWSSVGCCCSAKHCISNMLASPTCRIQVCAELKLQLSCITRRTAVAATMLDNRPEGLGVVSLFVVVSIQSSKSAMTRCSKSSLPSSRQDTQMQQVPQICQDVPDYSSRLCLSGVSACSTA